MTAEQYWKRYEVWQDRLRRLGHTRLQPRLFTGVDHALKMAMFSGRMERGCGHDPVARMCDECLETVSAH